MKPANGSYRLRSDPNPPGTPDMRLTIGGDSISGYTGEATCGKYEWDAAHDWFVLGGTPAKVVIRFLNGTQFVAIVNPGAGPPAEKTYTGSYTAEP